MDINSNYKIQFNETGKQTNPYTTTEKTNDFNIALFNFSANKSGQLFNNKSEQLFS